MPFDALTMAAVSDELQETCVGGRIQGVFLPAPQAIGLEIYARGDTHYVFASAHPQHARVHLTQTKLSRGSEDVTPLLLLLRKYVRDGRLAAIEQPALERTVRIIITKASDFGKGQHDIVAAGSNAAEADTPELTTVSLIIEVMGRYSNIILVDGDGVVMEAVKHVPAEINRYRVTLPRHPYVLPPPQEKEDPRGLTDMALGRLLAGDAHQPAWQALMRSYRGVSPAAACEAVYRAAGRSDTPAGEVDAARLAASLASILAGQYTHRWQPSIARDGDAIIEYAPYELTQFGERSSPAASVSAAIQTYYDQETLAGDYAGAKQDVSKALTVQRERVLRRKHALEEQQRAGAEAEALRLKGEMLLAYQTQIAPGQAEAMLDMGAGEPPLRVVLDPRLSAVENAQAYFKRYGQARDSARTIPPLLEVVRLDLAYLDQLQLDLELAKTSDDVREVRRALVELSKPKDPELLPSKQAVNAKKKPQRPAMPGRKQAPLTFSRDGFEILVGRNARQNDYVTFELASAVDVWLHARGVAGSHVIVRSGGRPVPQTTLEYAASLAAGYSSARGSTSVLVDYTQRRYVHRSKGGGPGLVTYSNEKTIHAKPAAG